MSSASGKTGNAIYQRLDDQKAVRLPNEPGTPELVHVFDDSSRLAVKSALAAGRPLLVRGEPGVGKTQLAAAAAVALERPLFSFVVNSRTEASDLMWHFDSVRRLAEAQVCGVLRLDEKSVDDRLRPERFILPGPLWWGFHWENARDHCVRNQLPVPEIIKGADAGRGRVVLIDEIDKADSDLPNGLLEALGSGKFTPYGCATVFMHDPPPLVIVTTNEERVLPDAFVRRCLVLHLVLPEADGQLRALVVERGREHFPKIEESLMIKAADLLIQDRRNSPAPKPGQAEFFDLLRAVTKLVELKVDTAENLLGRVAEYTLKKQSRSE